MRHLTLGNIADRIGGSLDGGDPTVEITGVRPLALAGAHDITIAGCRAEVSAFERSAAAAAVVATAARPIRKPVVRVADPRLALAHLLELFHRPAREVTGIDPRAYIAADACIGTDVNIAAGAYVGAGAIIGDRVDIYPGVFVGDHVRVGDDSVLYANVSAYAGTLIGKRVRIHSGTVIGSDGFGYVPSPTGLHKIPQVGRVEIEDDVEIGANTTIDRATMAVTRIGRGTKIDNLVQVAHNVDIGENVCIVAQSGIAGSVRIGRGAMLGGGAGLVEHISIGEGARVGARAGVLDDVPPRGAVLGTPAIRASVFARATAVFSRLPEYRVRVRQLEERCERLEAALAKLVNERA